MRLATAIGNPFDRRSNTNKTYYAFRSKKHPDSFFIGRSEKDSRALTSKFLEDCLETGNLFEADKDINVAEHSVAADAIEIMGFVPDQSFELVKIEVSFSSKITKIRTCEKEIAHDQKVNG